MVRDNSLWTAIRDTDSCDDYPFASSYQGGAGASPAHILSKDNSAAGSSLGSMLQTNRVLDNDAYFVQVVP